MSINANATQLVNICCEQAVLGRGTYADEVRIAVRCWQRLGIDGVPATVIDGRQLIAGAQPVEVYEQALRRICARSTA